MSPSQQRRRIIYYWVVLGVVGMLAVGGFAFSLGRWMATVAVQTDPSALTPDLTEPALVPTDDIEADTLEETAPNDTDPEQKATTEPRSQKAPLPSEQVIVYITGAVLHPETYRLPAEARVKDVVVAAGGLTSEADSEHINLAEHITDAEHISIPRVGEEATPSAQAGAASGTPSTGDKTDTGRININTASAAEIEALPKIGVALAQRIIDWRTENGLFQSPVDIQKVKGITPAVYDAIKEKITVE